MVYKGEDVPFTQEDFERIVPLSPKAYREVHDKDLNEVRVAAGLPVKGFYEKDDDIKSIQSAAGIL
jgi:hypothetical protein